MTSAALGSIEDFQDSNFFGYQTTAQAQRSGINPESSLYYYQIATGFDGATAIQAAIIDGVDILSGSWTTSCGGWCNPSANCANINTFLRNGLDAGMLSVFMVGNAGQQPPLCTLSWPGYSPHTIGVAGIDTSVSGASYGSTTRWVDSGRGPVFGQLSGGGSPVGGRRRRHRGSGHRHQSLCEFGHEHVPWGSERHVDFYANRRGRCRVAPPSVQQHRLGGERRAGPCREPVASGRSLEWHRQRQESEHRSEHGCRKASPPLARRSQHGGALGLGLA